MNNFFKAIITGGLAATISKTICSPIEVVKLRLQNMDEIMKYGSIEKKYDGIINCLFRIIKDEGLMTLWKGNYVNVMFYFPSQSVNFAFKSYFKKCFPQSTYSLSNNILCGSLAGVTSMLLFHNLDYVRTRLSNDAKNAKRNNARQYNGVIDVYKQTYRKSGIKGLYRGISMSCLCMCVYRGLYFGLYDTLKEYQVIKKSIISKIFLSWGVTIVSGAAAYPFDTIRRRMMMTADLHDSYKNSYCCFREIIHKEGFSSLYKGHGANIIRSLAGAGVLLLSDKLNVILFSNKKHESINK